MGHIVHVKWIDDVYKTLSMSVCLFETSPLKLVIPHNRMEKLPSEMLHLALSLYNSPFLGLKERLGGVGSFHLMHGTACSLHIRYHEFRPIPRADF